MSSSEDITPYEHKSFDELLDEIESTWRQFFKLKHLIPRLFEKGRVVGMSDDAIRTVLTRRLGVPYRTMLRYIPEDAKQSQEHVRSRPKVVTNDVKVDKMATFSPPEKAYQEHQRTEPETPTFIEQEPTGEIVRIEMDWSHCNHFVKWFRQQLEQHKDNKDGKYIIEYDIMTKEISVDIEVS